MTKKRKTNTRRMKTRDYDKRDVNRKIYQPIEEQPSHTSPLLELSIGVKGTQGIKGKNSRQR